MVLLFYILYCISYVFVGGGGHSLKTLKGCKRKLKNIQIFIMFLLFHRHCINTVPIYICINYIPWFFLLNFMYRYYHNNPKIAVLLINISTLDLTCNSILHGNIGIIVFIYFLICWCFDCISREKKTYLHFILSVTVMTCEVSESIQDCCQDRIPFIKLLHAFKSLLICHHLLWFRFISLT